MKKFLSSVFRHDVTPIHLRKRYLIFILAFFGQINLYTMRVDFSVAFDALTENRTVVNDDGGISYEQGLEWSSRERALIISTYVYGYIGVQLVGGYFASKINGRLVMKKFHKIQ